MRTLIFISAALAVLVATIAYGLGALFLAFCGVVGYVSLPRPDRGDL